MEAATEMLLTKSLKSASGSNHVFVANSGKPDVQGEMIPANAWNLERFNKNPIILYQHSGYFDDDPDNVIGQGHAYRSNGMLLLEILKYDSTDHAQEIKRKVDEGFINTVSVGFVENSPGNQVEIDGKSVYKYSDVELLEVSIVNIPADANATRIKSGFTKTKHIMKRSPRNISDPRIREAEGYSFCRAIEQLKKSGELKGLEKEIHKESVLEINNLKKGLPAPGNIAIPSWLIKFPGVEAREKTVVSDTSFVETTHSGLIPLLEIDPKTIRAGAELITNLRGDYHSPKGETGVTVVWAGETDPSTESTPEYGNVAMDPKRMTAYTSVSLQAIHQSSFSVEQDLRNRLSKAFSIEFDRVALLGTGTSGEPLGITNQPGFNIQASVSNAIEWSTITEMINSVDDANVLGEDFRSFMCPSIVRSHLLDQKRDPLTGIPLMNDRGEMALYPHWMNSNLKTNAGTGGDEQILMYGAWDYALFAIWSGVSIQFNPFTTALNGTAQLILNAFVDTNVKNIEAFTGVLDVKP